MYVVGMLVIVCAAPQYDHDVVTVSWCEQEQREEGEGEQQTVCVAHFRQPYSAAKLRSVGYCHELCSMQICAALYSS